MTLNLKAIAEASTGSPVKRVAPDDSRSAELAKAIEELEAMKDSDARKSRARTLVPTTRMPESESQEWREALKRVSGLSFKEYGELYRENRQRSNNMRLIGYHHVPIVCTRGSQMVTAEVRQGSPVCDGIALDGEIVSPVPHLHDVLVKRDGDGAPKARVFILSASSTDEQRFAVTDTELVRGGYITRLGMPIPEDSVIRDAITTYIRMRAADMPQHEATPRWVNGQMVLPPREILPDGYLQTTGDETTALALWRTIADMAATAPNTENVALGMGASYAAPYVEALKPVRPESYAVGSIGESRTGKTTTVNVAAAMYGSPRLVNPALSESSIALGDMFASLGCLPGFRDEVHSAGWTNEQWHDAFMRLLNGAGRRRSSSDGSGERQSTPGWYSVWFLSGNSDPRFNATDGVQARVVVMGDPHTADAELSDTFTDLIGQCYGWPVQWFSRKHPAPADFAAHYVRPALDTLEGHYSSGVSQTVAKALAIAVAGAQLFGDTVGVPALRVSAIRAAHRVLDALADNIADFPGSFDDQLLHDVWNDVHANPSAWLRRNEYAALFATGTVTAQDWSGTMRTNAAESKNGHNDLHGILDENDGGTYAAMLPSAFDRLTSGKDYANDQALSALFARGLLSKDGRKGYQRQVKINGRPRRFYMFRPIPDECDATSFAVTPTPPAPAAPPVVVHVQASAPAGDDVLPAPSADGSARVRRQPSGAGRRERQGAALAEAASALASDEPLRLLDTLYDTFAPLRKGETGASRPPYWMPEMPGITYSAFVPTGFAWKREYDGPTVTLDRSGAWLSAASSALFAHGKLERTGAIEFNNAPGYYRVDNYAWTEEGLPHPVFQPTVKRGKPVPPMWVPAPTVALLKSLESEARWGAVTVLDSYTTPGVRLNDWTRFVNEVRAHAITTYGRQSAEYDAVKQAIGHCWSLMLGTPNPGGPRLFKCKIHRPDWTHTAQSLGSATLFRWADDIRKMVPEHAPVALRNVDAMVIPTEALEVITTTKRPGGRKPMVIDPTGITLGSFKIEGSK